MTTSSTSSLLPATSTTSNLPLATSTTTNLPPATSTTSTLPPATSFTSQLPPATSTTSNLPTATSLTSQLPSATSLTSHLPSETSLTSHLLPSISTASACNINEADLFVVSVIGGENLLIEAEIEELDDVTMNKDAEGNVNLEPVKINTPRPKTKKDASSRKMFVVRASTMRLGATKAHNLYSKMKGGTQPSLYLHNETPEGTTYWEPNVDEPYLPLERKCFDMIEECVEFYSVYAEKGETKKDASSREMFIVRASTMRLGATKAHNLYSKIKGGTQYVHGTSDDFKNHIRDVNAFIGESDAQMLINKMENRKNFVPNFTFQYLVENSELVAMFWADEVAKCN
nr:hypothetical protein [Tanacetum cinerariifolium]